MMLNVRRLGGPLRGLLSIFVVSIRTGALCASELPGLNKRVEDLLSRGEYAEAEPLAQAALALAEKTPGSDAMETAVSMHNRALLYYAQGRRFEAESLFNRSLAIREKSLGPDHPAVAAILKDLAVLCETEGRDADAERFYVRSLAILEKTIGPDHPDVAIGLHLLAELYRSLGRFNDAEPLFKRSLAIREKSLGPRHPRVAQSLVSLSWLYKSLGRPADGEPFYDRALAIWEESVGPGDLNAAASAGYLSEFYRSRGRCADAEPLYKRFIAVCGRPLASDHLDVARLLDDIADLYASTDGPTYAEPLYKRSLAIREKFLGPDHVLVAASLNRLAIQINSQSYRQEEAEPLYKRSLAILEKHLGPDHLDVATSLNNLALLYLGRRRHSEAEPLLKRSLAIREKAHGPTHPTVAQSISNLAGFYDSQGQSEKAETLLVQSVAVGEKTFGSDSGAVAALLEGFADLKLSQKRLATAESLLTRALTIREAGIDKDALAAASILDRLADLRKAEDREAESEPFLQRALAAREAALGAEHPGLLPSLKRLAEHSMRHVSGDGEAIRHAQPEQARIALKRALAIQEKLEGRNGPSVVASLEKLAQVAPSVADEEQAYRRIAAIQLRLFGHARRDILERLTFAYARQGKVDDADAAFQAILTAVAEEWRYPEAEQSSRDQLLEYSQDLAVLLEALGRPALAVKFMEQAAVKVGLLQGAPTDGPQATNVNGSWLAARYLEHLARLLSRTASDRAGWQAAERASLLALDSVDQFRMSQVAAAEGYQKQMARDLDAEYLRLRYLENKEELTRSAASLARTYQTATEISLKRSAFEGPGAGHLETAFHSWERGLARSLLELIARIRRDEWPAAPKGVQDRERELDTAIEEESSSYWSARYRFKMEAAEQSSRRLSSLEAERRDFLVGVRRDHPEYHFLRHPEPVALQDIQSVLEPGEVVIEYALLESSVAAFVVGANPGRFQTVELALTTAVIQGLVAAVRAPLVSGDLTAIGALDPRLLQELYQAVFGPVERIWAEWPEAERPRVVHVVPSGPLHYLPFEALIAGAVEGREAPDALFGAWRRWEYLAERYAVAYWQSATLLYATRRMGRQSSATEPLLAFADPVFDPALSKPDSRAVLAALRDSRDAQRLVAFAAPSRKGTRGFPLDRLESSGVEALAAGRALGIEANARWLYLRERASEEEFRKLDLKRYRFLLLSTHGLQAADVRAALVDSPLASARRFRQGSRERRFAEALAKRAEGLDEPLIALSLRPEDQHEKDGLLTMREIFDLKFDAEMATLSACVTGLGESVAGEGVMGLTRALLHAGAKSALVSLWYVETNATAQLVSRSIAEAGSRTAGESISVAVNRARLALLMEGRGQLPDGTRMVYAHPFFWAPFVLYGDWK